MTMATVDLSPMQKRFLEISRELFAHIEGKTTNRHPEGPRFMPAQEYLDPDLFEQEQQKLFRTTPLVLATTAELQGKGAYKAKTYCGVPVVLARDSDGTARAFINACSHRGSQLCSGAGKLEGQRLICPYHHWTYDLKGQLIGVTSSNHFGDIDREDFGLVALPCEERHGLIFVILDPEATMDLDSFLGDFGSIIADRGLDQMTQMVRQDNFDEPMNWKFAMSSYCENYHFAFLHKTTVGELAWGTDTGIYRQYGPHSSFHIAAREIHDFIDDDDETLLKKFEQGLSPFLSVNLIFPNSVVVGFGPGIESNVISVFPKTLGTQNTEFRLVGTEPENEEVRQAQQGIAEMTFFVGQEEDYVVMERAYEAVSGGMVPGLTFGANEPVLTEIHRNWAESIGRTERPDQAVEAR